MQIDWSQVPEFLLALQEQNSIRDSAFFLETEELCGLRVLPMSIRHFLIADAAESPFIRGESIPSLEDCALFLWIVSQDFCFDPAKRDQWVVRHCGNLTLLPTVTEIIGYIDEAMLDSPGGGGPRHKPTPYSWVATLVDIIASEYGWSERDILNLPMKRAFTYQRRIQHRRSPDAPLINSMTDAAIREHWQQRERAQQQN